MFTTKRKIQKDKDAEPTEFEETVAQVNILNCFLISFILNHWNNVNFMMFDISAGIV